MSNSFWLPYGTRVCLVSVRWTWYCKASKWFELVCFSPSFLWLTSSVRGSDSRKNWGNPLSSSYALLHPILHSYVRHFSTLFLSKNSTLQKITVNLNFSSQFDRRFWISNMLKIELLLKLSFCTKIWVEKCVLRKWRLLFLSLQLIYLHCSRLSARASQVLSAFFHWSKSLLQNPLAADLYYFSRSSSMLRTIGRELLAVFFRVAWAHIVWKSQKKYHST